MGSAVSSTSRGVGVVYFGHPLLDIIADVDEDFLKEYDILPGSVNLAQPTQIPLFDRLIDHHKNVEYVAGGSAMNTARTMTWLRRDLRVSYVGSLGKDRCGSILQKAMKRAGVHRLFEVHETQPTGVCAVLVHKNDRSLLAHLGAAVHLSSAHMNTDSVLGSIRKATVYYAEGFFLNTASSPDNLLTVAHHASQQEKLFCFNLNAPYICSTFKERVDLLIPYINILFGNEEDIVSYAKLQWPDLYGGEEIHASPSSEMDADSLSDIVKRIAALPQATTIRKRLIVVTRGTRSTLIVQEGCASLYPVPPLPLSEIVDVSGAGDAFVGGFLSQYLKFPDVGRCAEIGHAAAQECIRHSGATLGKHPPALYRCS